MPSEPTTRPAEPPPPDDGDDDLVAYLDGELADEETQAVESKLAVDEEARRKAEKLQKTYDLLDYLPRSEPSPSFATRTLTQLNPALADRPSEAVPRPATGRSVPPVRTIAAWCGGLVACALVGYLAHLLARPHLEAADPAKGTSEQVRLLERLPLFLGVDDFDFLKQLDTADFFGEADGEEVATKATLEAQPSGDLEHLEALFKSFPSARQQQLRKLDDDLSRQEGDRLPHLVTVLERYAVWLDRLPDGYRKEVLTAPAAVERLETIRLVKTRLWRESLPRAVRERIQEAVGPAREQLVAERKQQDADRKHVWDLARQEWVNIRTDHRPWPFENPDLARHVEEYADKVLKPRLGNAERTELDQLRKDHAASTDWYKWYLYGHFLAKLAESHPTYPESATGKMVKKYDDLQTQFVNQLVKKGAPARRQLMNHPASGKWPDFAEAVLKEAHELKVPIPSGHPLGPNKVADYPPAVREFYDQELARKLTKPDRDDLAKAEAGAWPDHSRKLIELARKYDLSVPGVTLPGEPSKWDRLYRPRPTRR